MKTPDFPTLWASCSLTGDPDATQPARSIAQNQVRYSTVANETGLPWWWIGCIHQMESGGDFTCHLYNGDPLADRTVNVPAGRPINPNPPYTWEYSAQDSLRYQHLSASSVVDFASALDQAERYNGLGYRSMGILSPYVWAGTNHAQPGKYVSDGHFDPSAISEQPGVAAMMLVLQQSGIKLF